MEKFGKWRRGNKVYVHPITGDLQQCSQKLGFYNETSCPGGTVCERFPILVPGFQDYCCWETANSSEQKGKGTTTTDPDEEFPFPIGRPDGVEVEPIIDRPPGGEEGFGGSMELPERLSSRKKPKPGRPDPDDYEPYGPDAIPGNGVVDIGNTGGGGGGGSITGGGEENNGYGGEGNGEDWEAGGEEQIFRPISRRLPKCENPSHSPLIDRGNRLRNCYYQQCPREFRCEFNKDVLRYICCGSEADGLPPPGLPPLPNPRPLVPRPMRPRPGPYGQMLSDQDTDMIDADANRSSSPASASTKKPIRFSSRKGHLKEIADDGKMPATNQHYPNEHGIRPPNDQEDSEEMDGMMPPPGIQNHEIHENIRRPPPQIHGGPPAPQEKPTFQEETLIVREITSRF
ncbi:unnamed protein product, partial [Mesorhabditis spiculigera]